MVDSIAYYSWSFYHADLYQIFSPYPFLSRHQHYLWQVLGLIFWLRFQYPILPYYALQ
jgi:hypothetical protein